jgi:hypothetical protein
MQVERTKRREQNITSHHGGGEGGSCYHTNATGSHVGGYHDGALAGLELVEHPITLVLLLVAVDGCDTLAKSPCQVAEKTYTVLAIRPGEGSG